MPVWRLDNHQRVCVDRHCNVHFQHYSIRGRSAVTLRWRQFLNLNDVVMDLDTFENMKYYPLGKNLWLQRDTNGVEFYHCKRNRHFLFHERSWRTYLMGTHRSILSFLRHEAVSRRQHAPSNAAPDQSESGDNSPPPTQQQTLSWATTHARHKNEQRKKHTNVPKRDSTDTGCPFSFSSSVDALRATTDLTSDMEEGEVCAIQVDCEELGDFESLK